MANGDVDITEGSGLKVATYTISEDAATRHLQRVVVNTSAGVEATNANGQAAMAASQPVVIASDQSTLGVTIAAAAAAIAKAEDAASASADVGVPAMAIQRATPADTAADLDYSMLQMSSGRLYTNSLLSEFGKTKVVSVSLTPTTAILGAGDIVADSQQVDAALRASDGTGILQSITLIDQLDQKAACTMYILSANVSMGTENEVPTISDADATNILGFVDIGTGDYKDIGGVAVANIRSIGMPIVAVSGTDDLYIAMVNGAGTPTYNSTSLIVRLGIQQD